ncbi:uncharacterized protein LOC128958444 [Oppia nitens]|uniref:uncharacterized protein LOC128958444 n=1 Tax=Oppia nitens TaxID=1686743 RepID=UPI0023DA4DA6|nr:uncharacterized protein LOC128958444 [Oppia nitens]
MYIVILIVGFLTLSNVVQCDDLDEYEIDAMMRVAFYYGDDELVECNNDTREVLDNYCKDTAKYKKESLKFIQQKVTSPELQEAAKNVFSLESKPVHCKPYTVKKPEFWDLCGSKKVVETGAKDFNVLLTNVIDHCHDPESKLNLLQFICYTKLYMEKIIFVYQDDEAKKLVKEQMHNTFFWALDKIKKLTHEYRKLSKYPDECDFSNVDIPAEHIPQYKSLLMNWFLGLDNCIIKAKQFNKSLKEKKDKKKGRK